MFSKQEHAPNLSQRLSEVLDDIGVNEVMVMKRRRLMLLHEAIHWIDSQINSVNISMSYFGSQTEGSTTEGLNSDVDCLSIDHGIRIIQDWSEWERGKRQLLMVQDDTTSPGYCLLQAVRSDEPFPELLQAVRSDEPLPEQYVNSELFSTDTKGRVLLRHSCCLPLVGNRHGPAGAVKGDAAHYDRDFVHALHCSSWPKEVNPWLQKQNVGSWPTEDMKRYSSEQGCFVVPVGSRTGMHQDTEWRISTSFAERCLMFGLNMTQIKCYVLMKMILKRFLKPMSGEAVSSFMCKNILFYYIANLAASNIWNECSLLTCLNQCLQALLNCIFTEQCPHFIISGNNLLADKLTSEVKNQLMQVLSALTENIEQSLLDVQIDDLGARLYDKLGNISPVNLQPARDIATKVLVNNVDRLASILKATISLNLQIFPQDNLILTTNVFKLCLCSCGSPFYQIAKCLCTPLLCSIIGSRKASADIQHSQVISPEAMAWLFLGQYSDICTGRLKLASALYCSGDLQRCESILAALREKLLHTTVMTYCHCYLHRKTASKDFEQICSEDDEEKVVKDNIAFCFAYLPSEINCIPNEIKYEMFRSTEEERPYRGKTDFWMDWAVVDSQPYLYFLQYKVYSQLQRPADQHRALEDLARTINTDPNLGHRETAWNLLGQCMEQENRNQDALYSYMMSLRVRGRNNAAKWLICRLLARVYRQVCGELI